MNSSWLLLADSGPSLEHFYFCQRIHPGAKEACTTSSRTRPCLLHKSKPQWGTPGSRTGGEEEPRGLLADFCQCDTNLDNTWKRESQLKKKIQSMGKSVRYFLD